MRDFHSAYLLIGFVALALWAFALWLFSRGKDRGSRRWAGKIAFAAAMATAAAALMFSLSGAVGG